MSAKKIKKIQNEVSVGQKYEIIRYHHSHPLVSQVALRAWKTILCANFIICNEQNSE
jgi:hypothetical protein